MTVTCGETRVRIGMGSAMSVRDERQTSHLVAHVIESTHDRIPGYQDTNMNYQEKTASVKLSQKHQGRYDQLKLAMLNAHDIDPSTVESVRLTYTIMGQKRERIMEIGKHTELEDLIADENVKFVIKVTRWKKSIQTESMESIGQVLENDASSEDLTSALDLEDNVDG